MTTNNIDALVFDVFGTVVDWRGSITREGRELGERKNIKFNWARFANAWRGGYAPAMDRVRRGELPWLNIDQLHRLILDELLVKFKIDGLTEADKDHFNRSWHRLKPWPDSVRGLKRLKKKFVISPLSNGNFALLVNMARNAGLPWDCVISAELFNHYKPDPETYEGAAKLLGLPRDRVMLVAAHKDDLRAAQRSGLRAAFITRPKEFPPSKNIDLSPESDFDYNASNLVDLADQLGI